MYEYKYIYIYSRYMNIYKNVYSVEACCVCIYCYVRIAAKAKLWFNLRPHISFR